MDSYLAQAKSRLVGSSYSWTDSVAVEGGSFDAVARRSTVQLTKFGVWESFFVFRHVPRLDPSSMQTFMQEAFRFALEHRASKLPRGLFAGLAVFAVAMSEDVEPETTRRVREQTPPKHWAANEIPVVYEARAPRIHYFEKTPVWGAAYFKGFRKQIEQFLAP